jgi:hypothetical protein
MIYFDSDMSKSTNTVVYFDWKTVIYIYACENVAHNLCNSNKTASYIGIIRVTIYAANGKVSHIHRRMCKWDYTEWITRSFVSIAKEGGYVRITNKGSDMLEFLAEMIIKVYLSIILTFYFPDSWWWMSTWTARFMLPIIDRSLDGATRV